MVNLVKEKGCWETDAIQIGTTCRPLSCSNSRTASQRAGIPPFVCASQARGARATAQLRHRISNHARQMQSELELHGWQLDKLTSIRSARRLFSRIWLWWSRLRKQE